MSESASNSNVTPRTPKAVAPPPSAPPGPPRRQTGQSQSPDAVDVVAEPRVGGQRGKYRGATGFLTSFVVHVVILLVLALLVVQMPKSSTLAVTISSDPGAENELEQDAAVLLTPNTAKPLDSQDLATALTTETVPTITPPELAATQRRSDNAKLLSAIEQPSPALLLQVRPPHAGGVQGRTGPMREKLLGERGGTPQTQNAVALGLAWLAAHQHQDGGWRFDLELEDGPCHGQCRDSGTVGTTTGATGLALLAFLGDGQTHMRGEYRDVVNHGLYYLKAHAIKTPHGADLREGTMYAQGIATLALCEAYGMTQDESLRGLAQQAVNFICYAQHSKGGWRYYPKQPGDTTVFGWQMMALKSALMAGLDVPSPVLRLAERFLNSVETEAGAYYGYITPDKLPAPTAIGLLVRMYTGWDRNESRLQLGVAYLAGLGPSKSDIYFDYYATLVLCQYGGPKWDAWNKQLRKYLIVTQATTGHERGSWFFPDKHSNKAGRLYVTAMCVMILEVYYRYMPLYGTEAVDFKL